MATFKFYDSMRDKKILRWTGRVILILTVIVFWSGFLFYGWEEELDDEYAFEETVEDNCNVAGIELRGTIVTYIAPAGEEDTADYDLIASEDIMSMIIDAEEDPTVKAIMIEVDSYGGSPVAGEEIASALKRANKPTVAFIRDAGLSAAYWAVSAADHIISSPVSDIGSIGVTVSYLDNVDKNKTEGLSYNQLSTGKYKDMFDPNRLLTADERALIMRDLNIVRDDFIKNVAANRGLDINKVSALADGSSLPGTLALENGLVDQLGNYYEAQEYLEKMIGETVEICWY